MTINIMFSKDSDETRTMHTKSKNIEILMGNGTAEIIRELLETLLQRYEKGLEESVRGIELVLIIFVYYVINFIKQV